MATRKEIPPLTGLRGVAALLVMATHYAVWTAPFDVATRPNWIAYFLGDGVLGMTIFFTLSGFVIAYHYTALPWGDQPGASFYTFAVLRISRLYPALLLFFALTFNRHEPGWTVLHVLSLQSWSPAMLHGLLVEDSIYHVSWSISTKLGFYLAFALMMLLWANMAPRFSAAAVAIIVAAYIVAVLIIGVLQPFATLSAAWPGYFEPVDEGLWRRWFLNISPYSRVCEFGAGVAAALLVTKRGRWIQQHRAGLRALAAITAAVLVVLFFKFYWASELRDWYVQLLGAVAVGAILANSQDASRVE